MMNIEILQEIHKLSSLYEKRWGKEVDYIGIPLVCTQEKICRRCELLSTLEKVFCAD